MNRGNNYNKSRRAYPCRTPSPYHPQQHDEYSGNQAAPSKTALNRSLSLTHLRSQVLLSRPSCKIRCFSSSSSYSSSWRIIAPSPSSRHLMRAVSGLGMEDPVFLESTEFRGREGGEASSSLHRMRCNDDRIGETDGLGDMQSFVSVASDPTADLNTGMDAALFQACLRDLGGGLSRYSRMELFLSSRISMSSLARVMRQDMQQHQQLHRTRGEEDEYKSSSFFDHQNNCSPARHQRQGLTLDDVPRGASTGSGLSAGRFYDTEAGPPKRAVRKCSIIQPPALPQRKASRLVLEESVSCSTDEDAEATTTSSSALEPSCSREKVATIEMREVIKVDSTGMEHLGAATESVVESDGDDRRHVNDRVDAPPKMAHRIQSGGLDDENQEEFSCRQRVDYSGFDENSSKLGDPVQLNSPPNCVYPSIATGSHDTPSEASSQTRRTSGPELEEEAISQDLRRDRATRTYSSVVASQHSRDLQLPDSLKGGACQVLEESFRFKYNDDEELDARYVSAEEGLTGSLLEFHRDNLPEPQGTGVVSRRRRRRKDDSTPATFPMREASTARHYVSARCRENPRRAPALASLHTTPCPRLSSEAPSRNYLELLHDSTNQIFDLIHPSSNQARSCIGNNKAVGPELAPLPMAQTTMREKVSVRPYDHGVSGSWIDEDGVLRRPVRKDSPFIGSFSSPMRRGPQVGTEGMNFPHPRLRDCVMGIPLRVESGNGSRFCAPTSTYSYASTTDNRVDEGESTVVINDTERAHFSVSADQDCSVPTCASPSADESSYNSKLRSSRSLGQRLDSACCSVESTIALKSTMESERCISCPFIFATNRSHHGVVSTKETESIRLNELNHESYRSTDSTVSLPVERWDSMNWTHYSELDAPPLQRFPTPQTAYTKQTESTIHLPGESLMNNTADSFGGSTWITEESLPTGKLDILEDFSPESIMQG